MKRLALLCALSLTSCSVSKSSGGGDPAPAPAAPATPARPTAPVPDNEIPPIGDSTDTVIQWDEVEAAVLADIQDKSLVSVADEKNMVYLSAANYQNLGDDVEVAQQAALLGLNMLSNGSKIESIRPLKNMPSVFAVNITDFLPGGSFGANALWTQLEQTSVLPIISQTARGNNLKLITGKNIPIMHLQVFLETAFQGDNYYAIKGIPTNEAEFLATQGVNRQAQYDDRNSGIHLAGFAVSGIAPGHNRLVERLDSDEGSCWKTYDIDSLQLDDPVFEDDANFFKNPFPFEARSVDSTFQFSAGEILCTQRNGLYNMSLWNAAGVRQNEAPTTVVLNLRASAIGLDANIKLRDCTGCHTSYLLGFRDEIGRQIRSAPFAAEDKTLGQLFFKSQDKNDQVMADENRDHAAALSLMGIQQSGSDPINVGAIDKLRDGMDSREAAAFFYMEESDFLDALSNSALADNEAGQLAEGGKLTFFALQGNVQVLIDDLQLFRDLN